VSLDQHELHLRREAATMALYVAVCLIAALVAVDEDADHGQVRALAVIWGTTIGLAVVHLFAFRLASRLTAPGGIQRADLELAVAQIAGAAAVAVVVSIPVVLLPTSVEFDVARIELALLIAMAGAAVSRQNGAGVARSLWFGAAMLALALAAATLKNVLSAH
jgi:NCAIR mutase (PurE)-related protein